MNEFNVQDLVQQAFDDAKNATIANRDNLAIRGGNFPAGNLYAFWHEWRTLIARLEWRMFEYVNEFQLRNTAANPDLPEPHEFWKLERARIFGDVGDLEVRRDGETFYWRYIGVNDTNLPVVSSAFGGQDFWATNGAMEFHVAHKDYYQWRGIAQKEQRVDSKWLDHIGLGDENVKLQTREYLRAGRVEFVRFIGFVRR